jgi:hypothetical protein
LSTDPAASGLSVSSPPPVPAGPATLGGPVRCHQAGQGGVASLTTTSCLGLVGVVQAADLLFAVHPQALCNARMVPAVAPSAGLGERCCSWSASVRAGFAVSDVGDSTPLVCRANGSTRFTR